MPFYEYQCSSCGHGLEAMQKVSDPPLKKCPHCGKPQLQKLMSAPVFRLKGGGWYETDFKSEQERKRNLADRSEAEASKDDKKTEAPAKDSAGSEAAKPEKGADKTAAEAPKKPAPAAESGAGASAPRRSAAASKPNARKTAKRPVRALKRGAAKPARRR